MCLYNLNSSSPTWGPLTLFSYLSSGGNVYGGPFDTGGYNVNNDDDGNILPLTHPGFSNYYVSAGYGGPFFDFSADYNTPWAPVAPPIKEYSQPRIRRYLIWNSTGRDGDSDFAWAPIPVGYKDINTIAPGWDNDPSYPGVFTPSAEYFSPRMPLHSSSHSLIDAGRARFEYHGYINLITEFVAHGGTFVGKTYNAQFKIKWFGSDRETLVHTTTMKTYSTHDAKKWKDVDLSGTVPYGARYAQLFLTWTVSAGISKANFYGPYGLFIDHPTATDDEGHKLGLWVYFN